MSRRRAKGRTQSEVAFAIAGAIAVPAGAVLADEPNAELSAPGVIEEIVVTAQRREESLQKTSVAMQVVSAAQLKEAGIREVADLETVVPGLQIAAGGAIPQIYIRGVGDFGATPITNPAVAMNADGIYLAQAQSVAGGLFDLARVEVLKGPQGTLYGRNASGGAINFISNKPDLDHFGGYADVEGGDFDLASVEAALNLPINSQLAVRLAGQDTSRNGYLTQGFDDDHHQSARFQALWKTDTVSLLLATDYSHVGGVGQGQTLLPPSAAGTNSPWVSGADPRAAKYFYAAAAAQGLCIPAAFFPGVSNPGACPSVAPYPSPPFPPGVAGPYTSLVQYPNRAAYQDNSFWRYHAEFSADLGGATLTLLPAYQTASLNYRFLPGGLDYQPPEQSHATSVEARLSGRTPSLKWVAGAYYFDQRQHSNELVSGGLIQNNNPVTEQSTRSKALFGELTFSVTEATRLIAGARYTTDKKGIDGTVSAIPPNVDLLPRTPLNKCFVALPNPCLLETYSGSASFDKFTWKVGIEQDLTPKNILYATLSTGFKAGGFDQSATPTPGSTEAQSFNPETLTALELGSRNGFLDDRLQVNAEAFYWRYKDHQEPHVTIDGQGQIAFDYVNAGEAKSYGFDLDVVFKPTGVDTLHAGVEYLHSRYDTFEYDVPPNAKGSPFVRGAGNGFTTFDPLSPLRLNALGIQFITLRRRDPALIEYIRAQPASAWRRIELEAITRTYRTPRILDATIQLRDYEGPIRQIIVADLGHEEPTVVLTNQLKRSAVTLIGRYAQRMLIENGIADGVDFFHMDALSSVVAMKVDCDLQLTLMASSLYRLFGERLGNGYATAKSQHIFRDFINAVATVSISEKDIQVRFQKRAHNPLLLAAGFDQNQPKMPWLGGKRLQLVFG